MLRLTLALAGVSLFAGMPVTQAPAAPVQDAVVADDFRHMAPAPWIQDDPADSLYRLARESLNRARYREALQRFQELREKYPDSGYVPDALYWEAFALYRLGTAENLRLASERLELQKRRYPRAATRGDGDALLARINSELSRLGDRAATARVARSAEAAAAPPAPRTPRTPPTPRPAPAPAAQPAPPSGRAGPVMTLSDCEAEAEVQVMALHALMQNDPERAMPLLRRVLARRDPGSECLRRHALFVVGSRQAADAADILLSAARTDPDAEVRQAAVFWLSRVDDPRAVPILDSVLRATTDDEVRQAALFALGGRGDRRSTEILKQYALAPNISEDVRHAAIMHLMRTPEAADPAFVRQLYAQTNDPEVKASILMLGMRSASHADTEWLLGIATSRTEDADLRRAAIMGLSRAELTSAQLTRLVDNMPEDEESAGMLIMVFMQRADDPAVVGKLIALARGSRNEDIRRAAIMALSRSDDPRATQYLAEILDQ